MQRCSWTIAILVTTFIFTSCNQVSKSDDKEKALMKKENELLIKENELLKKEHELNQKTAKTTTDNPTIKQQDYSTSNNLEFLKELNGKYPARAKLFENSSFTERLKSLLGDSRYNFLSETWAVETPMEFSDNIFVASACQAHNCSSTNFIIVVDFSVDIMYAGIREDDEVKTYSEDGSNSPKVIKWANSN